MRSKELLSHFQSLNEQTLQVLSHLVQLETPSGDASRSAAFSTDYSQMLRETGCSVDEIPSETGVSLLARYNAESSSTPLLIIAHSDTVWPAGTLEVMPFRIDSGAAYGPGVYDMKASLAVMLQVFRVLECRRPVYLFVSCDEESGSTTTRSTIEALASESVAALVLEPPLPQGGLKTARKGVGSFRVKVAGRAAHAGLEPEKGINAILELSRQIIDLHGFNDPLRGISLNVGFVTGGSSANVVAAEATAEIDVRCWTLEDQREIERRISALTPYLEGARLEIAGGFNRPPMERSEAIAQLYYLARRIGEELDLELTEGAAGGGSDGNFVAALGKPVLDGLGPEGAGAHAPNEHIIISRLPHRATLITRLIEELCA